ncbi:hypothetical protein GQ43DRAFT_462557 [Delitschia confertaspora ATCC 74209]|uniref:Uncharacterized protein n=1 Tax=Delitschia confertaspora ATCC 74209 TaxID=1513339 RepID=A0A9P4JN98_9PLEO|nr:hypothetical protein GQ43DRAFT_462557 [Delitschia confertaspora ATCC 74209]
MKRFTKSYNLNLSCTGADFKEHLLVPRATLPPDAPDTTISAPTIWRQSCYNRIWNTTIIRGFATYNLVIATGTQNPITSPTSQAATSNKDLSVGAKAGISIGFVLGAAALAGIGYLFYQRRRHASKAKEMEQRKISNPMTAAHLGPPVEMMVEEPTLELVADDRMTTHELYATSLRD